MIILYIVVGIIFINFIYVFISLCLESINKILDKLDKEIK